MKNKFKRYPDLYDSLKETNSTRNFYITQEHSVVTNLSRELERTVSEKGLICEINRKPFKYFPCFSNLAKIRRTSEQRLKNGAFEGLLLCLSVLWSGG